MDDGGAASFEPRDVLAPGGLFCWPDLQESPSAAELEPGVGEIKRMFIRAELREKGVGRRMLSELESAGRKLGYSTLRLETGLKQPDAIRLYESAGHHRVACYGQSVDNPLSVCFEKALT